MCVWKGAWRKGKSKPTALTDAVWEKLKQYWDLDSTKAHAATNSQNRRSDRGGLGIATHNVGAKTYEMRMAELEDSTGVEPDLLTMLEETHKKKGTDDIQDPVVRNVVTNIRTRLSQESDDASSSAQERRLKINQLVLEETPKRKGSHSFLGTIPRSEQSFTSPAENEIEELRRQLEAQKEEARQKDAQYAQMMQQKDAEYAHMAAFLSQNFPGFNPLYPQPPPPPPSPPQL